MEANSRIAEALTGDAGAWCEDSDHEGDYEDRPRELGDYGWEPNGEDGFVPDGGSLWMATHTQDGRRIVLQSRPWRGPRREACRGPQLMHRPGMRPSKSYGLVMGRMAFEAGDAATWGSTVIALASIFLTRYQAHRQKRDLKRDLERQNELQAEASQLQRRQTVISRTDPA